MRTKNRFTTHHQIDTRDIPIYISLEWDFYPGCPATYYNPEESDYIELVRVIVPDHLESRQEEVKWIVEDNMEELRDEAMEQIYHIFEQWREPNEYD